MCFCFLPARTIFTLFGSHSSLKFEKKFPGVVFMGRATYYKSMTLTIRTDVSYSKSLNTVEPNEKTQHSIYKQATLQNVSLF